MKRVVAVLLGVFGVCAGLVCEDMSVFESRLMASLGDAPIDFIDIHENSNGMGVVLGSNNSEGIPKLLARKFYEIKIVIKKGHFQEYPEINDLSRIDTEIKMLNLDGNYHLKVFYAMRFKIYGHEDLKVLVDTEAFRVKSGLYGFEIVSIEKDLIYCLAPFQKFGGNSFSGFCQFLQETFKSDMAAEFMY